MLSIKLRVLISLLPSTTSVASSIAMNTEKWTQFINHFKSIELNIKSMSRWLEVCYNKTSLQEEGSCTLKRIVK